MRVSLLLIGLCACSDYQISGPEKAEPGNHSDDGEDDITGGNDDTAQDDTGDPAVDIPVETAAAPTYVNTANTLYAWDPDGELEVVADLWAAVGTVPNITDIAIDLDGHIYGCSSSALFRIHAETGETIQIAELDVYLAGLTFVSDGRLVGAGEGVWFIDTTTGALTDLVREGRYETSGDIIGLPDGLLYWTVWGEDDDADQLIVIDPDTGQTMHRGDTGVPRIFGLGYAGGTLYGFTDTATVIAIDPDFGGGTGERPLGTDGGWWGATTNPVRW
jgi:hypothetical protein